MKAEDFNDKYPVGSRFKYYPIKGCVAFETTRTRSKAWELGHGETVVNVNGRSGCVSIEHLEFIGGNAL